MHQKLADATFRIECGNSSGSGFSYRNSRIVVTNCHVIEPAVGRVFNLTPITAITEEGVRIPAKLLRYSDKAQYDFAILELQQELPQGREILQPSVERVQRGSKIVFAGFPHAIHDLLVHEAIVSGPCKEHAFYIDGSVNGGNSGGPIVSSESGHVVGIVTQRRFMNGQSLDILASEVKLLAEQSARMRQFGMSLSLGGIDLGLIVDNVTGGLRALSTVIESNSNVGIGIGFHISYVNATYDALGIP